MKLPPCRSAAPRLDRGFTLVEIMIVVAIIGLLSALALPAFSKVTRKSKNTAFVNDLRIARDTMETYAIQNGGWPPDGSSGFPAETSDVMPPVRWSAATPIGGHWDWDFDQFGFKAGVSVYQPTAQADQMEEIDQRIDDGNLSTGAFRSRDSGYIYVLEF